MKNYLVPRCETRSAKREHWNAAGRGLRKIDRSRVSGEAAQTPPKKIFWR